MSNGHSSLPYHFYSSAVRPTAIEICVSGHFTSGLDLNLIVAKNNRIELFLIGPEGLTSMKEIGIYGKIKIMQLFRPPEEIKDFLFILTARFNAVILEAKGEGETVEIITCAYGNLADRRDRISEYGILSAIDPEAKVIALRIYEGVLNIIPIEKGMREINIVNIRIEETEIQDLTFLYGYVNPTIVMLHKDSFGRHIKSYEWCLREKDFITIPYKQENIEIEAIMIISVPEPLCGAIIVGDECVSYYDGKSFITTNLPKNSSIICYAKIDSSGLRYILGDMSGKLFMLLLENEKRIDDTFSVKGVKVELLGEVTIPECITYLDNGVLFIGSKIGDSQLVKLNEGLDSETGSYVTILESFNNLGPIVDMIMVDLEKQGQGQLITCSGGFKEGSLRIIRKGIEIQQNAAIDLPGVKGVWALNVNSGNEHENILVLSFVGHTRVLSVIGDEVEETEIFGFQSDSQTLYCSNISLNIIVQVVPRFVRLLSLEPKQNLSEWMPSSGRIISIVAANNHQIICTSGSDIFYLEFLNNVVTEQKQITLEFEVSCVDITPFPDETDSKYAAIGLWNDITVRILSLPDLEEVHREYLGGDIISRSLLFASFEGINYLFCALGDGCLFYFTFNRFNGLLMERKRITLGTQPLVLRLFKFVESNNVFVCSDRPAVIYSADRKLVFSNVNLKEVNNMCSFNSDSYPDSLVIANDTMVSIGTIDKIQKLNIRSIRLNEGPRRIAYQECSQSLGVITTRFDIQGLMGLEVQRECASSRAQVITNSQQSQVSGLPPWVAKQCIDIGAEVEVNHFLLFDQYTFEVLHAHQMLSNEFAISLISCKLGNDLISYYIVGTALVYPSENEPRKGRIIMFQVDDGRVTMIHEKEVKGGCYSLAEFNGKLLASINNAAQLFEWTEKELKPVCSHLNNIIALFVKTKGDFVLIGDLMRAVTLLRYRTIEKTFEEIARDYNPHWMTAIEILDDDTFLGAENSFNLFICQKNSSATNDSERQVMQEVAQFHLGDMVNIFRRGSLLMPPIGYLFESTYGSTLIGTISGAVGVVTHIPSDLYFLLSELQKRISMVITPMGKIDHSLWRSFTSDIKTEPSEGFIDGDLIECFLDLSRRDMVDVVAGLQCPVSISKLGGRDSTFFTREMNEETPKQEINVDTVIKIVEELTRLH